MSIHLPPLSLDDVTRTTENPFTTVNTLLSDFNAGHVGPTKHVPLWLLARDPDGKVQGGLTGQTYWSTPNTAASTIFLRVTRGSGS